MKQVPNKIVKKWFDTDIYDFIMKQHNIIEDDNVDIETLEKIDKQLIKFGLELYWFDNGGNAWCIKNKGYKWE